MINRSEIEFHATSMLICSIFNETVHVALSGDKNLAIHHNVTSKACQSKRGNIVRG